MEPSTPNLAVEITAAAQTRVAAMSATSAVGLMVGSIIFDERVRLELDRECLHQQLNEKYEEINQRSKSVKNFKDKRNKRNSVKTLVRVRSFAIGDGLYSAGKKQVRQVVGE